MSVQLATRVDDEQAAAFRQLTKTLGTTPADALRMFVSAFNINKGFPYDVRLSAETSVEAFNSEDDALAFADHLALNMVEHVR